MVDVDLLKLMIVEIKFDELGVEYVFFVIFMVVKEYEDLCCVSWWICELECNVMLVVVFDEVGDD